MLGWILAGGILLLGSIYDIRCLCLPLWLMLLGFAGSLAVCIGSWLIGGGQWWEILPGLFPGTLFLVLAFLTKEQIGYGDGLVLLILGGYLDSKTVFGIWMSGLFGAFLVGVILLVCQKAGTKSRLPFIPCLFAGYLLMGIGEMMNVL